MSSKTRNDLVDPSSLFTLLSTPAQIYPEGLIAAVPFHHPLRTNNFPNVYRVSQFLFPPTNEPIDVNNAIFQSSSPPCHGAFPHRLPVPRLGSRCPLRCNNKAPDPVSRALYGLFSHRPRPRFPLSPSSRHHYCHSSRDNWCSANDQNVQQRRVV